MTGLLYLSTYIKLITIEFPFDSWHLAELARLHVTSHSKVNEQQLARSVMAVSLRQPATAPARVSSLLSRGLATPYLAGNVSSNGPFFPFPRF